MIINMTTFAVRTKHYIDETLESLFQSDGRDIPVNLIVGSSDTSHIEKYRGRLNIVPWDEVAEAQAIEDRLRHNCNLNAIRSLRYGDDEQCLCCEDDIVFEPDWFHRLMQIVDEIEGSNYILNLAHGTKGPINQRYQIDSDRYLCGAQGLFYPSKRFRSAAANYIAHNMTGGTNDSLVGKYAKRYGALYNATPPLIGHIGDVSTFHTPNLRERLMRAKRSARRVATDSWERIGQALAPREVDADEPGLPTRERQVPKIRPDFWSSPGTSELFVALLRTSLGTAPRPNLSQCNWQHLSRLAAHHGVLPIVYRALREQPADVPEDLLQGFKSHYVANVFHNQLAQADIDAIATAFSGESIPVIVMKGVALQRTLYDDPGLRVLSDIDLLVDMKDVGRASQQLRRMGVPPTSDHADRGPLCNLHLVHCRPKPPAIPVELHWRLFESYQPYVFDLDVVRAQARPFSGSPDNVHVMAPEHELAHLCVHLDRHAVTYRSLVHQRDWFESLLLPQGIGRLQWLYDIALYVRKRAAVIDWDAFVATTRKWAIDGRVYATLELCRRALGVGPPAEVLQALDHRRPRLVERMAHHAVLASYRTSEQRRSAPELYYRSRLLKAASGHALRYSHAWMSLFPESAYLRAKYGVASAPLHLRARHLREVVPGLLAETRARL